MTRPISTRRPTYATVLAIVAVSTNLAMMAYAGPLGNVVTVSGALGSSAAGTAWILASMSVGLAVTLLAAGVLADDLGHRRVFAIGAGLFALANAGCALADSTVVFVIARIVAGVGATGMVATGLGLVASVSKHDRHRAATATWWSVSMGSGIALGPVVTGLLDLIGEWRTFYAALAAGGLALAFVTTRLSHVGHDARGHCRRLDLVGFVLLTATLTLVVTAIVEARVGARATATALLAGAAVLLVTLVVSQRVRTITLVDTGLFRRRTFLAATAAALGTGLGVISVMSFACTFLVLALGLTTLQAGAILAVWSGTSALAALVLARVTAALPGAVQLVGGLAGVSVGIALLAGLPEHPHVSRLVPGLVVAGLASGLLNTGLAHQSVASLPVGHAALGTGANNTARYIGSSIGVTVASAIAATSDTLAAGWNRVAELGAVTSLVCAALVAILSLRHSHNGPTSPSTRRRVKPRRVRC